MEQVLLLAICVALLVTVCSQRWLVDTLIEALNDFRGGPPTPMHPSPINDAAFLRRRARKIEKRGP
jgi:hypothetical protein